MKEGGATGFLWNFHRYRLSKLPPAVCLRGEVGNRLAK